MKRRSKAGGKPAKVRRRSALKPKARSAPKAMPRRASVPAGQGTEVARLTRELNEALEQQTATSEVLRVISSSPGDLEPVFAAMLEKAVRICDAKFGNIYRRDGDGFQLVATHNAPPGYAEARRRLPQHGLNPKSVVGRMAAVKAVVHVADASLDLGYIEQSVPELVLGVELGGLRTGLAAPIGRLTRGNGGW